MPILHKHSSLMYTKLPVPSFVFLLFSDFSKETSIHVSPTKQTDKYSPTYISPVSLCFHPFVEVHSKHIDLLM